MQGFYLTVNQDFFNLIQFVYVLMILMKIQLLTYVHTAHNTLLGAYLVTVLDAWSVNKVVILIITHALNVHLIVWNVMHHNVCNVHPIIILIHLNNVVLAILLFQTAQPVIKADVHNAWLDTIFLISKIFIHHSF